MADKNAIMYPGAGHQCSRQHFNFKLLSFTGHVFVTYYIKCPNFNDSHYTVLFF